MENMFLNKSLIKKGGCQKTKPKKVKQIKIRQKKLNQTCEIKSGKEQRVQ